MVLSQLSWDLIFLNNEKSLSKIRAPCFWDFLFFSEFTIISIHSKSYSYHWKRKDYLSALSWIQIVLNHMHDGSSIHRSFSFKYFLIEVSAKKSIIFALYWSPTPSLYYLILSIVRGHWLLSYLWCFRQGHYWWLIFALSWDDQICS